MGEPQHCSMSSSSPSPSEASASTTSSASTIEIKNSSSCNGPTEAIKTTNIHSSNKTTSQVRVGVRVRPLTSKEIIQDGKVVVDTTKLRNNNSVGIGQRRFTYDSVFDSNVTQSELYKTISKPLLSSFLDGYNATIMAYGQTGSGKTFTMGSEATQHSDLDIDIGDSNLAEDSDHGLIPRFMSEIFSQLEKKKTKSDESLAANISEEPNTILIEYKVSASFLEVYGEDVHDLLDENHACGGGDGKPTPLPVLEDATGTVVVPGLKCQPVKSSKEALSALHDGTLNRTTAATNMNLTSSRSHAVFTIHLEQTIRRKNSNNSSGGSDEGVDIKETSRFTFVDLAGSERMKKTGAEGERAREGIKINEGLLALGNVINALADDEKLQSTNNSNKKATKAHVPYRQSKLTRLLQDALGGNSQTLFLACVSPSDTNSSETLSTLHYANRARNIKNAPTKNVDGTALQLQHLNTFNYILQCELIKQRFGSNINNAPRDNDVVATIDNKGKKQQEEHRIGYADESLWKRSDVQEYIRLLHNTADQQQQRQCNNLPYSTNRPVATTSAKSSGPSVTNSEPTFHHQPITASTLDNNDLLNNATTKFDDTLLDEVNPDEEMAILDQLLDIQQKDNEFSKEKKKDEEELKQVEGELEKQESMLLQLRESLKVYHEMKAKYEVLMAEVQTLEKEKLSLADQLEKATADPSKGCSNSIKKRLSQVESSLARARNETLKHRQMYRRAEQEAHKCRVLEQKINDLKVGKVALLKKQKEAAVKHREYTEAKTKEIIVLKRKERKAGQKLSKMETEIRIHKSNLEKRRVYCDKLSSKLKQTESHLMKLLDLRRKELSDRNPTKKKALSRSRAASMHVLPTSSSTRQNNKETEMRQDSLSEDSIMFAPKSEDLKIKKSMLEKVIADQISYRHMKCQYEEKVALYGDLMRSMVQEVKGLENAREEAKDDPIQISVISTHEQNIEDLELKIELVTEDMESLRARLPKLSVEEENSEQEIRDSEHDKLRTGSEQAVMQEIANLGAPVLRSLLWDFIDTLVTSEFDRQRHVSSIKRKDSAMQGFESEVESLNRKVAALSNDLASRRRMSVSGDLTGVVQRLQCEKSSLHDDLQKAMQERERTQMTLADMESRVRTLESEKSEANEKLTVAEVILRQRGEDNEADAILQRLQNIWNELGMQTMDREIARSQIDSCLQDTCIRKLDEAFSLKAKTLADIDTLRKGIDSMYAALGKSSSSGYSSNTKKLSLLQQLDHLHEEEIRVRPAYNEAVKRRSEISRDAKALMRSMEIKEEDLSSNLVSLIHHDNEFGEERKLDRAIATPQKVFPDSLATPAKSVKRERRAIILKNVVAGMQSTLEAFDVSSNLPKGPSSNVALHSNEGRDIYGPPKSLEENFLEACKNDIRALKVRKSELLVKNKSLLDADNGVKHLSKDMHLSSEEIVSAAIQTTKKHSTEFPTWWSPEIVDEVSRMITSKECVVRTTKSFSVHLELIHESLTSIATGRRLLSNGLKGEIERAHKALLKTVDGEIDASEAYASFHDALLRLPPLSKEYIHACISEMNALVLGVETMTQSEIEALTVVWEALSVDSSERGQFFSSIDKTIADMKKRTDSPFDSVLPSCTNHIEEWVRTAVMDATKVYRKLNIRLLKLEKVHDEVEKLRSKQDAKSRIISLDSELRILTAKLADWEESKCSKQRLLTKKANSSQLLKEERFRKQMQGKYVSKLEQLSQYLKKWQKDIGTSFDSSILSDEIRELVENDEHMKNCIEQRTAFMHLRTVATSKRTATPSKRRRDEAGTGALLNKTAVVRSASRQRQSKSARTMQTDAKTRAIQRPLATESPLRQRTMQSRQLRSSRTNQSSRTAEGAPSPKAPSTTRATKPIRPHVIESPLRHRRQRSARTNPSARSDVTSSRKEKEPTPRKKRKSEENPSKQSKSRRTLTENRPGKNKPLSPVPNKLRKNSQKAQSATKKQRETLMPFGHLLPESPTDKENAR